MVPKSSVAFPQESRDTKDTCQSLTLPGTFRSSLILLTNLILTRILVHYCCPPLQRREGEPTGSLPEGSHLGTMAAKVWTDTVREPSHFVPCSPALLSSIQSSFRQNADYTFLKNRRPAQFESQNQSGIIEHGTESKTAPNPEPQSSTKQRKQKPRLKTHVFS